MVVELLESTAPDAEVIAACREIRERGYELALDDFVSGDARDSLAAFADILKVDFRLTTKEDQADLMRRYRGRGIRMLAEKIETREEFERARQMGYDYFQGYFFARPVILSPREVPGLKMHYLRLLSEVHRPDLNFNRVENLIKQEVALCYKLLQYLNSAAFSFHGHIESVRQAMVLLGEQDLRKWISLAALPHLAASQATELMVHAIVRARFCESIAASAGLADRASDLFLMGMFSLLDAMVGRPLEEMLAGLQLADDIRDALLSDNPQGRAADVYLMIRSCEAAEWDFLSSTAARLGIAPEVIPDVYLDAAKWAADIFRASQQH
jgi:EAL and modified HD-GYP domain-containing signal transduction protein